ncbi:MAG: hypothetical protein FJZ16_03970 [Candidatus Omnitrophica bacterium]|nr:hypothetical protein [Candidatus Omnitrophota bacterium]
MKITKKFLLFSSIFLISFSIFILPLFAQEKTITLDVENMNIETVLKMIADQSGLNVSISKNVTGNVTVKLENVSVYKALDAVLNTNNYLYSIESGIINVYTYQDLQQGERFVNLQTKVFTLEYADVTDLKRVLLSVKTPRGKIEINARNNQVIVTDTPEKIKEIETVLKELDQKTEMRSYKLLYSKAADIETKLLQTIPKERGDIYSDTRTNSVIVKATPIILKNVDQLIQGWDIQHKQVLIEAKILEVTLDETTKLGINWEYKVSDRTNKPTTINPALKFPVNLTTEGGIFNVGSLTPDEYAITLEALKSKADTEVLSSPRVAVIDGQEASILVGSSEPYTVATTDPITKLLVEDIKFVDVGIKLRVTPQIGEDNYVTMKIHPEISTARRVAEVNNVVARDTTEADTTMMVKNGETIILGGLIKNSKKKTVKKLPLLGDIPVLGLAFRSKNIEDVKKEIIVFITPHILTNENRQTISTEEYKASTERTGKTDELIKDSIEKSSGTEILPPTEEERSEAIRKEMDRLLGSE